jgi:hypothetical protein
MTKTQTIIADWLTSPLTLFAIALLIAACI